MQSLFTAVQLYDVPQIDQQNFTKRSSTLPDLKLLLLNVDLPTEGRRQKCNSKLQVWRATATEL